jgi:folate-binding protein YgfZ
MRDWSIATAVVCPLPDGAAAGCTLPVMAVVLDRAFVRASGPDAVAYLHSMVSNDVAAVPAGGGTYALLLTPKARVIADMEVFNTGSELVLACPGDARDVVIETLLRARFRKKVDLEPVDRALVWGDADGAMATLETPIGPYRLVARAEDGDGLDAWELARIEAGIPRFGREFGPDSMPAEAGLLERAVSFTKGCYPGQEPIARLHYRGHANRGLRGLRFGDAAGEAGASVAAGDREVGRITSVALSPRFGSIGLAVLRREVADGDRVDAGGVAATVVSLPFG